MQVRVWTAIKQRMILIAMIQETRCNRTSESGPSPFPKSDANHLQLRIALNNKAIAIVAKPVLDDIVWSRNREKIARQQTMRSDHSLADAAFMIIEG